jgi:dolichol-phosphate mannosyltransferase
MSLITGNLSIPSLSVIIPCFNEYQNVHGLRDRLLPTITQLGEKGLVQLIFVDDGSTDDTWDALLETFSTLASNNITVRFERHPKNMGLGAALRTGISAAEGSIIITTDSDGTYAFELIPEMIEALKDDIDLVTASPYHPLGSFEGVSAHRLILSRGSSLLYRILVNWNVYTYTSIFRAYRREIFDHIKFESNGFLACAEILVKAHFAGFKVKDFPAVLRVREYGVSKAKLVRTTLEHLKFLSHIMMLRIKTLRANPVRSEKL